jgi:hypothetical protein
MCSLNKERFETVHRHPIFHLAGIIGNRKPSGCEGGIRVTKSAYHQQFNRRDD